MARINDARKRLSTGLARLEAAVKTDADLALVRGVQASLTGDKADKAEPCGGPRPKMTDLLERLLHEALYAHQQRVLAHGIADRAVPAGRHLPVYSFALVTGAASR